jgi:hypothetical protein
MHFQPSNYLLGLATVAALAGTVQPEPTQVRVVDARTHQPIPYASVGVPGKPLGTVANAQGRFLPAQTGAAPTDTLVVSCVGYLPRRLPLAALQQLPELLLEPHTQALNEVIVKSTSWKRRHVGREAGGGFVFYNFHTQADTLLPAAKLGREGGAILRVRPHSFIEDAHVFISQWRYQGLRFRLNVRAVDADNHPAASLLTQDVQFTVPDSINGWQHIDLRPYNVNVGTEQRVAVTIEWLEGQPKPGRSTWHNWPSVVIPGALSATHHMVHRHKSEDAWQVQPVNLSLYITTASPN